MTFERNRGYQPQPNYRGGNSSAPPQKREAAAKGHDAVLKALQSDGREVVITLMSGDHVIGKVVGRDKFTITMQVDDGRRMVIYKHAIESFVGEEKAKAA